MQTPRGDIRDEMLILLKHEDILLKMSEAKSPEECYEIARPVIGDIGQEEFEKTAKILMVYLNEQESGVLTEADLDMIAGGKSEAAEIGIAVGGTIAGTAALAATMAL